MARPTHNSAALSSLPHHSPPGSPLCLPTGRGLTFILLLCLHFCFCCSKQIQPSLCSAVSLKTSLAPSQEFSAICFILCRDHSVASFKFFGVKPSTPLHVLPLASYGADCSCARTQCLCPLQTTMLQTQVFDWQACYALTSTAHRGPPLHWTPGKSGPLCPCLAARIWKCSRPFEGKGRFGLEK